MASLVMLNVPDSQGLQVWSLVDDPRVAICSPGAHTVQAWHCEAATFQKLPAGHSVEPSVRDPASGDASDPPPVPPAPPRGLPL